MNHSLHATPKKLTHLSQLLRCLHQTRTAAYLSEEALVGALDDQIRARYPKSLAAEVAAVAEARRGIWGGVSGGVYVAS